MTSKYQMWMTYNGGTERLRFPVLPETINIAKGLTNTSVNIQGLGEVVIQQDPAAIVISFSSFFPETPFPGVQGEELMPPLDLKDKITVWQKGDKPVLFVVTGSTINLYCTIEHFDYYEKDLGTLYYTLMLKEHKEVKARQVKVENPPRAVTAPAQPTKTVVLPAPVQAPARVDNRVQVKTHTVVKGDTLWGIASKHLGNGSRYTEIYELNRNIIKNPNLIQIGWVLKLP